MAAKERGEGGDVRTISKDFFQTKDHKLKMSNADNSVWRDIFFNF